MQIKKTLIFFLFAVAFSQTGVGNTVPTNSGYNYQLYKKTQIIMTGAVFLTLLLS